MTSDMHEVFLKLVRLGIGHTDITDKIDFSNLAVKNWVRLKALADEQGLSAVILDGIDKCHIETTESTEKTNINCTNLTNMLPLEMKLEWIGEVLQDYEGRCAEYKKAIGSLADFYNRHGFKIMVLKGYACSLDWPKPDHRPCGDIDIWMFGKQKAADVALEASFKNQDSSLSIDNSHHHHSVFNWGEFMVENHYDFINTHVHRSSRRLEAKLKELVEKNYKEKEILGAMVYLPGADFNFLFLLRHMANHFVGKEMTLRQLLDWALFIEHHHEEIDWKEGLAFLEAYGLLRYFNLMALISVERLGFNRDIFHCELKEDELKERVFNDIIVPEYDTPLGKGAFRIMAGKTHRWWSNRWKHRLCYPDSLLSSFVYGVWAKIQKPAHFLH